MANKYQYLFPFEKVPQGSKILIYGAGDVGIEYLKQMLVTNYATVKAIIDKRADVLPKMIVPCYTIAYVKELNFDYVVLAFKQGNFATDVTNQLCFMGIKREKIIYQTPRIEHEIYIEADGDTLNIGVHTLAYKKAPISIAIKLGPGLGDAVIRKRLIIEIIKMAPEARIDIYVPGKLFVESFYSDVTQINEIIEDAGGLYQAHHKEYSLSMAIFFMIQVNHIEYDIIKNINLEFAEAMKQHIYNHNKYGLQLFPATQNSIHFMRAAYKGWNCYSLYNYTGVFHIADSKVNIPLKSEYGIKFSNSTLSDIQYITFNYGNGVSGKNRKDTVSKQWPKEYFMRFVDLFKNKYSSIKVVQVGDMSTEKIPHADEYILGENIEYVKYVLKNSIMHIDIEGGLMHLATQIGTKCVCLLGITQANLFAYPQNINIVSEKCSGCYCLYDDTYECAKGLDVPLCMKSITPEMVMNRIINYMDCILAD